MTTPQGRKRILLVTPENRAINRFRRRQFNNFTQLTMPYLAGFIDESRYQITLVDEYNQPIPYEAATDLVAVTVNTPNAPHCYEMARRFRQRGARVVMGGPHATLRPEEAAGHCDHLVVGEAEETWPRFLEDYWHGRAERHYACERTPSLRGLPTPRRDLIQRRWFTKGAAFATRGCPHHCAYCNLKQIYGEGLRTRPVSEVIADLRGMSSPWFVFWDDNFFGDPDYAAELLTALRGLRRRWAAQVTIDRCGDERLLELARQAGCVYLFVGLESFSDAGLASVEKPFNRPAEYRDAIRLLHKHGICIQAGIVFGLDTDTPEVFADTLAACEELGIDGATISLLTPLPGTRVHEQLSQQGRLPIQDWACFDGKTQVAFRPKQMTPEELMAGYSWFRRRFYSMGSILKRLSISRTNILYNLFVNLGYKWSLGECR